MTRFADLSPAQQRQVTEASGKPKSAPRVRAGSGRAGPGRWRCHQCGELPKSYAAAERHADAEKHYRIEVVL